MASIKHWPDRVRGLRELLRVLRPGGLLLLGPEGSLYGLLEQRRFPRLHFHGGQFFALEYDLELKTMK